jgi:hypothetical protein
MPFAVVENRFCYLRIHFPPCIAAHSEEVVPATLDFAVHCVAPQVGSDSHEGHKIQNTNGAKNLTHSPKPSSLILVHANYSSSISAVNA